MNWPRESSRDAATTDQSFANLVASISDRLEQNEDIDLEDLSRQHPKHFPRLCQLLPAMQAAARLAQVRDNPDSGMDASEPLADAEDSDDETDDGPTLGDFRIVREIGHGGMGVVYEAEQISLKRRVALKVLSTASVLDSRNLARFKNESLVTAQLSHPNIVNVISVGNVKHVYYYAMPLIEGDTLAQIIQRWRRDGNGAATEEPRGGDDEEIPVAPCGVLSPSHTYSKAMRERFRCAAHICRQVAEALEYAHHADILHRDVKPSNVIVDADGKAYLTDFGLARVKTAHLTVSGDVVGTLRYMSPEQASGRRAEVGERSDVYSLGATLYELATLEPIFPGDNTEAILSAIANTEPRRPRAINSHIPRDLETIILKATAKDSRDRYDSASSMAGDLGHFLANEPIAARRPSVADVVGKWSRRHWSLVSWLAAAIGLLTVTLALSTFLVSRAGSRTSEALERVEGTLYVSDMQLAFKAWDNGWTGEVQSILKRLSPSPGREDRRGVEWHLLDGLTTEPTPLLLEGHQGAVNEIAVFPAVDFVASVGDDATLRVWNLATGELISTVTTGSEALHAVAVSPDGQTIATSGRSVILWDVKDAAKRCDLCTFEDNVESLAFSPDGQRIAIGTRYGQVSVYLLDGTLLHRIADKARHESLEFSKDGHFLLGPSRQQGAKDSVALWHTNAAKDEGQPIVSKRLIEYEGPTDLTLATYSRDGNYVAAAGLRSRKALLFRVHDGKILCRLPVQRDQTTAVAISPDALSIVTGHNDGTVSLYELDQALAGVESSHSIRAHDGPVTCLRYVDARRLVTCSTDGTVKVWEVWDCQPRQAISAGPCSYFVVRDMAYSPDGRHVAAACLHGLWIGDGRDGRTTRFRRLDESELFGIAFSPQGNVLATCCYASGAITLWDATTAEVMAQFSQGGRAADVDFSPDGRYLATTGGDNSVRIWRLEDRREFKRFSLPAAGVTLAFSPDGAYIACGGDFPEISIWDWRRRQLHRTFATVATRDLEFDTSGAVLASGHSDGTVRLWNTRNSQCTAVMRGHSSDIGRVVFSPDGKTLASTGDETIRLWSVPHGREFGILARSNPGRPCGIAFAPDGNTLAVGINGTRLSEATVRLWNTGSAAQFQFDRSDSLSGNAGRGRTVKSATNESTGHTYYLVKAADGESGINWTEAEQTAVCLGGHLVSINDAAENDWLVSIFGGGNFWIGLNDADEEGQFVWAAGEPLTYTNWLPSQPDNLEDEDYVQVCYDSGYGSGHWMDRRAEVTHADLPVYAIAEVDETRP